MTWDNTGRDIDPALPDDLSRFIQWLQTLTKVQEADEGTGNGNAERSNVMTIDEMMHNVPEVTTQSTVTAMQGMNDMVEELDVSNLHKDQLCTYTIITHHLAAKQWGEQPPQLLMVLTGEGGTGKSRVIDSVMKYFKKMNAVENLVKRLYTGIAASLIGGKTLHILFGLTVQ